MGRISIVAMDLDGTLLNEKGRLSPENRDALRACAQRGVTPVIASGRAFESARAFAVELGVDCGIISLNGARLDKTQRGPVLMENPIPEDTARRVFERLRAMRVYFECYTSGRVYMADGFEDRFHDHRPRVLVLDGYRLEYVDGMDRMENEALSRALKFVIYSPEAKTLQRAAEEMGKMDVTVTSSWADNVELIAREAGKGRALERFAREMGVPREEIMAFGDQLNDESLLRAAAWPVAMENAVDGLKRIARLIAPRHDRAGVGRILRKYVLDEKE